MTKEEVKSILIELLNESGILLMTDKIVLSKLIQILDARKIQVGKGTGLEIGTEAAQKIAFHGTTPVIQGATINDPAGGGTQDAEARTAINALIDRLQDKGIIA